MKHVHVLTHHRYNSFLQRSFFYTQNKTKQKKQHNQYGNHIIINLYLITVSKRSFGLVLKVGGRDEGSASDAETQLDAPEYDIELVDLLQFVGTREVVRS